MIPRPPLLVAVATIALFALAVGLTGASPVALALIATAVVAIAAGDAALAFRTETPSIERSMPRSLSLARRVDVRITVRNPASNRALRLQVADHAPDGLGAREPPQEVIVDPGRYRELAYFIRPTHRGPFEFRRVELRIASPLGLWWVRRFVPLEALVRVYPNYSTISQLLAFEVESGLSLSGMRLRQRRGEGTEFHQLRDYRESDTLRSIDWKASARTSRLIAREYEDERNQQIVIVVDAGRRMLAVDGELSHFDHTLNALLLMSYVALRRGDAVGVMTVGAGRSWLAPRKGAHAINAILNHVYDIQPAAQEVDFVGAATELAVRQRRRALIVILSNVRDEQSDELIAATGLLKRRHLVFLGSLRESSIDEMLSKPVAGFDDALAYAGADRYLEARRGAHDSLRARGVLVEDCLCSELPMAITNRYLAIKRAGML